MSSFGFGGTNVHIVLDNASGGLVSDDPDRQRNINGPAISTPGRTVMESSNVTRVLVWSFADKDGITRLPETWKPFFSGLNIKPDERSDYLARLAHTLSTRRSCLEWRAYAVTQPSDDWATIPDNIVSPGQSTPSPNIAYIFSGVSMCNKYPYKRM